jgi:hypothetical protein
VISRAMITERPHVDVPHRLPVAGKFFAKIHSWMLRILPEARKRF